MTLDMKKIWMTAGLAILSLAGNIFSVPLFYGIDFIFGSIAVMIAIVLVGTIPAVLVAIIGASYTMVLWDHPYAMITFVFEALLVATLYYRRGQSNLVLGDLTFWLIAGVPMVVLFYGYVIEMGWQNVWFVALKQVLNGIFNALIASLILVASRVIKNRQLLKYLNADELSQLLFHTLLTVILIAGTVPILYKAQFNRQHDEGHLREHLNDRAMILLSAIDEQQTSNLSALKRLLEEHQVQLSAEMGLALVADGQLIADTGIEMPMGRDVSITSEPIPGLLYWKPSAKVKSTMLRWQNGQYRVQKQTHHPLFDTLIIGHQADSIITRVKHNSLTYFYFLGFLAAIGIIVANLMARLLSGSLGRLSSVASATTNGVVITNLDGRVEWVNEGFSRISGYSLEEMLGQKPGDMLQGEDTDPATVNEIRRCLKEMKTFEGDLLNYSKDKVPYWVNIILNPLLNSNGELEGFIAIETDVTHSKATELELRGFKKTLDQTLDSVFMFDADKLEFIYVNEGAIRHSGYSEAELLKMHPYDIKPSFNREQFQEFIAPLLTSSGQTLNFETIHQHKNGQEVPVEIFLQYFAENDEPAHFVAIVRETGDRLKIQMELYEQAERTRAVVNNMVDAVITIDEKGLIDSFNPAAETIFGYQASEVRGRNVKMLMPSPHHENHDGYLQNYRRTREAKIIGTGREVEGLRKDGSLFPMDLAVSVAAHRGKPLYVGIIRDITERKRLEKMKNEFVSTVSHELRTPLTSIRGALSLIIGKAGDSLDGKLKQMLELAERNSERLTLLINDLLDLEKIESGRMTFKFDALDLLTLIRRSMEDNSDYARQHDVQLELKTELQEAKVFGDQHRLMQVLANLISNAVKYSPAGEAVTIEVVRDDTGRRYVVHVRDKGRGIPEEFYDRIFQRFAQADSSDTREKGGTGLGLSITKAIVEGHQGRIDFDSVLGQGTDFYFALKSVDYRQIENAPKDETQPRVLICEDSEDVAAVLAEMLVREGMSCDVAASLSEARSLLSSNNYSILLLDLMLPDGDGIELIEELKASDGEDQPSVIVISAHAEERKDYLDADFVMVADWLQKPLDESRLTRALREVNKLNARPKILHIEDDLDIVEMIQTLVGSLADFSFASSCQMATEMLEKDQYDLVILDLELGDGSGATLLDSIKNQCPVVIFSAQTPAKELTEKVNAALTKSVNSNEELLTKIKQLLKPSKPGPGA